jgi:hypothetical protein
MAPTRTLKTVDEIYNYCTRVMSELGDSTPLKNYFENGPASIIDDPIGFVDQMTNLAQLARLEDIAKRIERGKDDT